MTFWQITIFVLALLALFPLFSLYKKFKTQNDLPLWTWVEFWGITFVVFLAIVGGFLTIFFKNSP